MDQPGSNPSMEQDRRRRVSDANLFYTRREANRRRTIKSITDYVTYIDGLKDWFDEPLGPVVWRKINEYAGYDVEPIHPPSHSSNDSPSDSPGDQPSSLPRNIPSDPPANPVDPSAQPAPVPVADTLVDMHDKETSHSVVQWCLKVMDVLYDKSVVTECRLDRNEKDAVNEGFDLDGYKRSNPYRDLSFQATHGLVSKTEAIETVLRKFSLSAMDCAMWRAALSAAYAQFPGKDKGTVADFDCAIEEARMSHLPKRDDPDPRLAHIGLEIDARYFCIQCRESLEEIHDTQLEIWHLRKVLERWREMKDNMDT